MLMAAFVGGPAQTTGYLVADQQDGPAAAIDAPLGTASAMLEQAAAWGRPITDLLITHAHWDHVLDAAELVRLSGARLGIHPESEPLLRLPQTQMFGLDLPMPAVSADRELRQGLEIEVGRLRLRVLECPGHCPGSVALYEADARVVFTGDVLFRGSIGRTDLWGSDPDQLLASIRQQLWPLGDVVRVYPGHGPATTIGRERQQNPYLQG